ncbi:hypothetical protein OQB78_005100 [Escherichia coli]|nr:hypothetical protein [Escherichia coli]EKW8269859.1 hypothetical protein [Escherichia coli]
MKDNNTTATPEAWKMRFLANGTFMAFRSFWKIKKEALVRKQTGYISILSINNLP